MNASPPEAIRVPLLDLQAQYRPIRAEVLAAMTRVADSQRFILGPEVEALEHELADRLEVSHVIGVSGQDSTPGSQVSSSPVSDGSSDVGQAARRLNETRAPTRETTRQV